MKKIKLLGIKEDQNYEWWKINLLEVIEKNNLQLEMEEINSVDEFVELNASSVPSILIDDEMVIEQNGHLVSEEEIESAFQQFFKENPIKMKKIVVPVDFSKVSRNALLYAENLSAATQNPLKVINVCHPTGDSLDSTTVSQIDDILKERKKQLEQFVHRAGPGGPRPSQVDDVATDIDSEVIAGFAKSEIINQSKKEDTEMILMGTTGESNTISNLLGSISTAVSQNAHSPVWLVPPKATYNGIENILYASNYDAADGTLLNKITNLAAQFEANIHLVHVNDKKGNDGGEFEGFVLEQLFKKKNPKLNLKVTTVQADSAWGGLMDYAQQNEIDLIALVTRHRSFWEKLRHQSTTKKMVLGAVAPMLVMHVGEK